MDEAEPVAPRAKPARRYRGLDPEQRRAQRRRRLLDAALERFGNDGYHSTTITSLCRSAGVTTAHFYEEFDGREQLLWELFDEVVTDAAEQVASAMAAEPLDIRAQTRAGLDAFLRAMLEDPRRGRIQCLQTVGISDEFEARRRTLLREYAAMVATIATTLASQSGLETPPRPFISLALVAGVNDAVVEWLHLEDPPPIAEVVDQLEVLFLAVGELVVGSGDGAREVRPRDEASAPGGSPLG